MPLSGNDSGYRLLSCLSRGLPPRVGRADRGRLRLAGSDEGRAPGVACSSESGRTHDDLDIHQVDQRLGFVGVQEAGSFHQWTPPP